MDVAKILVEVFDLLDESDVIITMGNGPDRAVDFTVRQPDNSVVRVRRHPQQKKGADALWDGSPTSERLEVRIQRPDGTFEDEEVHGQDELVALLSLACQDPDPNSPEAIAAKRIRWGVPQGRGTDTHIAIPDHNVLLRVMKTKNWRNWTWVVIYGPRAVSPEDMKMPEEYVTAQDAMTVVEAVYRRLATAVLARTHGLDNLPGKSGGDASPFLEGGIEYEDENDLDALFEEL